MDVVHLMKLAALTLFLMSSLPTARATEFKYCDKKSEYRVKVSGVEISPYPIVRGQHATFSISATTGEAIAGGKVVVDVSYLGWHIHTESHDLCKEITCPVSQGHHFVVSHFQILPGFAPQPLPCCDQFMGPGSYTLKMKMYDGNKQELMTCISLYFSIGVAS